MSQQVVAGVVGVGHSLFPSRSRCGRRLLAGLRWRAGPRPVRSGYAGEFAPAFLSQHGQRCDLR
jgi:hypothetical protein